MSEFHSSDIDKKLSKVKYVKHETSHLKPDIVQCKHCKSKICETICPANVYEWKADNLIVRYENCLECGACKIACEKGCIGWEYPKGACGVVFKKS